MRFRSTRYGLAVAAAMWLVAGLAVAGDVGSGGSDDSMGNSGDDGSDCDPQTGVGCPSSLDDGKDDDWGGELAAIYDCQFLDVGDAYEDNLALYDCLADQYEAQGYVTSLMLEPDQTTPPRLHILLPGRVEPTHLCFAKSGLPDMQWLQVNIDRNGLAAKIGKLQQASTSGTLTVKLNNVVIEVDTAQLHGDRNALNSALLNAIGAAGFTVSDTGDYLVVEEEKGFVPKTIRSVSVMSTDPALTDFSISLEPDTSNAFCVPPMLEGV